VVLLLPFPGSLSVQVTRAAATSFSGTPGIELLSEVPLVLLAIATAAALAHAWWKKTRYRLTATFAAAGVLVAYAASEGIKLLLAEPRPCSVWDLGVQCPPAGDWSLPSNHATLAFGGVVVIAIATRSMLVTSGAVLLAITVAAGRVLEGSHYLHDVAAGAVLAIVIVGVTAMLANAQVRTDQ